MVEFRNQPGGDDEPEQNLDRELTQSLRNALRPIPAPQGFTGRVLARAALEPQPSQTPVRSRRALQWAVAAILLAAISLGTFAFHQRRRRIAGEHARDQVLLALRITGLTIRAVREQVDRSHNTGSQQETP